MIGITIGDPNGVGPEILLRAYKEGKIPREILAIGDLAVLQYCNSILNLNIPLHEIHQPSDFADHHLNVLDLKLLTEKEITIGKISANAGAASYEYITRGTRLALDKKIAALVTLPVNKESIRISHPGFSGHTGTIAALCGVSNYSMMLVSDKLIVTHVSTHVSLKEAVAMIKKQRVLDVIRLTAAALKKLKPTARIAVAGLNPHAGEANAFGTEDSAEILPAVTEAQHEGLEVSGPHPADTVFYKAIKGEFDAVVCMYHDQGHIPIKILDFESAVNITLGLPIVRTSVDHGTAYDIAWKGLASAKSLSHACDLALKLIQ